MRFVISFLVSLPLFLLLAWYVSRPAPQPPKAAPIAWEVAI